LAEHQCGPEKKEMSTLPDLFVLLLTVALAIIAIYLALFYVKITSAAIYTTRHAKIDYRFLDANAHLVKFTKTVRLRANHKGISQYVHRNLSADGRIEIRGVVPQSWEYKVQRVAGGTNVTVFFPRSLARGEEIEIELLADFIDSFPSPTESVTYLADYNVEQLTMTIHLDPQRPCTDVRAFRITGAESRPLQKPKTQDGTLIELKLRNLQIGLEYCVEWDWLPVESEHAEE